jgi:integrase/recombinase XerD
VTNTLRGYVEDYLRLRRALGFKLERAARLLPQLVTYLEAAGESTITSQSAIAWARLPQRARPNHWAQRLAIARGFARYLQTIDPTTEVPPPGVFPTRRHRPTPYLWSQPEIGRLLEGRERKVRQDRREIENLREITICAQSRRHDDTV